MVSCSDPAWDVTIFQWTTHLILPGAQRPLFFRTALLRPRGEQLTQRALPLHQWATLAGRSPHVHHRGAVDQGLLVHCVAPALLPGQPRGLLHQLDALALDSLRPPCANTSITHDVITSTATYQYPFKAELPNGPSVDFSPSARYEAHQENTRPFQWMF